MYYFVIKINLKIQKVKDGLIKRGSIASVNQSDFSLSESVPKSMRIYSEVFTSETQSNLLF